MTSGKLLEKRSQHYEEILLFGKLPPVEVWKLENQWPSYLAWAVEAFRLASSGVRDETQIHTHMCYADFQDIIAAVVAMDADVISIETSRSQTELLHTFAEYHYPNEIGPGVYDIHSPRIPTQAEMENLLKKASRVLSPTQLWVIGIAD